MLNYIMLIMVKLYFQLFLFKINKILQIKLVYQPTNIINSKRLTCSSSVLRPIKLNHSYIHNVEIDRWSNLITLFCPKKWQSYLCSAISSFSLHLGLSMACGSAKKEEIGLYALKKGDISVNFTNWGATIVSLHLPDKNGM
jgi:hypothetical protein